MSDFDKEAEREKLREKFEQEEKKREATEQMSELLLKGATMTNAHCNDCGDPIFRYDGQEFCPTCQKPVTRDQQSDSDDEADGDGDQIEVTDPSDDAHVQFGGAAPENDVADDGAVDPETSQSAQADSPSSDADTPASGATQSPNDDPVSTADASPPEAKGGNASHVPDRAARSQETERKAPSQPAESHRDDDSQPAPAPNNPSVSARNRAHNAGLSAEAADELDVASTLLARTVRRYAERAAAAENPREAREHLQAAREAAEALDAATF